LKVNNTIAVDEDIILTSFQRLAIFDTIDEESND
jgi:hypothetical protein